MSDLLGGGPSTSNGRGGNARPQAPPVTTGSPSGVRGPRDIMRERVAREQRRKEQQERENMERARAEEEARLLEEDRRKSAERRAAAATAAGAGGQQRVSGDAAQRGSGGTTGQRISDNSQRSDRRSGDRVVSGGDPNQPLQGVGRGGSAVGGGATAPSSRPRPTQSNQQPRPIQTESSRPRPAQSQTQPQAGASAAAAGAPQGTPQEANAQLRSSFPHAFERWETLSAHWEGLTSFWIRRLEENSNEINRDPLSQQLARQVTDLSAAGANLFHAVVELQRLRASSERKFQRWFFDTRTEQERAQEVQAMTQATLEAERRNRDAAIADAVEKERAKATARATTDKQLAEMKRELQISKEEARRAWEELGRREQEERERTASLREGQPTLVGGVQVVPMMQGVPSRHGSARDHPPTREGPPAVTQASGPPAQTYSTQPDDSEAAYQAYSRSQRADPADPFVEMQQTSSSRIGSRPTAAPSTVSSQGYPTEYSQAPAVQPASTGPFYQQQQGTNLHPIEREQRYGPSPSEGALSDEEYEIDAAGDFIRDARGNKVRYQAPASDDDTDEYDVSSEREREIANRQRYGQNAAIEYGLPVGTTSSGRVSTSTTSTGHPAAASSAAPAPDYSGQAYGSGSGWEDVPRHHHPTRLSDVLEEDERSRTSASQVSRRE